MAWLEQGTRGEMQRLTQLERREQSEQRLLTAAAELIATEGFAAASLERIGQIAGYSRGLASQKFGSKDGLVKAVIAFLIQRGEDLLEDRQLDGVSPLAAILAYADVILGQIENDRLIRAFWVMMASAIANRLPIQSAFLAEHEKIKRRLSDMITAGQGRGEIDPNLDPDAAALSIGSTILGIGFECLLDPDMNIAKVRAVALETISRTLAIGPGASRG